MHLVIHECGSIPLLLRLVGAFNGFRTGCQYRSSGQIQAWQSRQQNYKNASEEDSLGTVRELLG